MLGPMANEQGKTSHGCTATIDRGRPQSKDRALSNCPMTEQDGEEWGAALPAPSWRAREAGRRKDSPLCQSERAERGNRRAFRPAGARGWG